MGILREMFKDMKEAFRNTARAFKGDPNEFMTEEGEWIPPEDKVEKMEQEILGNSEKQKSIRDKYHVDEKKGKKKTNREPQKTQRDYRKER